MRPPPAGLLATYRLVAVQSWDSRYVYLFGGHATGTGAHGMCGANAAESALRNLGQI
jgi:hypothetical protein